MQNKMEIYKLPDKELKVTVFRKPSKLQENTDKERYQNKQKNNVQAKREVQQRDRNH